VACFFVPIHYWIPASAGMTKKRELGPKSTRSRYVLEPLAFKAREDSVTEPKPFTPLESPSIPACRQTGMLGVVEIPAKAGASAPYRKRG